MTRYEYELAKGEDLYRRWLRKQTKGKTYPAGGQKRECERRLRQKARIEANAKRRRLQAWWVDRQQWWADYVVGYNVMGPIMAGRLPQW